MQGEAKDAKALYNKEGQSRVVFTEPEEALARGAGFTLLHADLPAHLKEYPKSLHVGGDRGAPEKVVRGEDEERAARVDGFKMIDKERDAEAAARLAEPEEKKTAKKVK